MTVELGHAPPPDSHSLAVANAVRTRILNGVYHPGAPLPEVELRKEFSTSNAPIRSALHILAAEGIVVRSPRATACVIDLREGELLQMFQTRLVLLQCAVQLAAQRSKELSLSEARRVQESVANALDEIKGGGFSLMHGQLMQWVFHASGNAHLHRTWDRTMLPSRVYVYESFRRSGVIFAAPIQLEMIDVIVSGDIDRAAELAKKLTRQTLLDLDLDV